MQGLRGEFEWPTLLVLAVSYAVFGLGTAVLWQVMPVLGPVLAIAVTTLAMVQHSSLQHEILHGHPFGNRHLNEALVFAAIGLFVPYGRFRDTHLAHHHDPALTDPYDDPEANYLDPAVWARMSRFKRGLYRVNNTLAGRMVLGPAISIRSMVVGDVALIRQGAQGVLRSWLFHVSGVALVVIWLLSFGTMPIWAYVLAAYMALGILKIRTFAEHQAHVLARGRSAVVEGRGLLALLFLNNNFHSVHHCKPGMVWYRLPSHYAANRADYLRRNDGYVFGSYGEVFRKFLFHAKDPVAHPIYPVSKSGQD